MTIDPRVTAHVRRSLPYVLPLFVAFVAADLLSEACGVVALGGAVAVKVACCFVAVGAFECLSASLRRLRRRGGRTEA